MRIDIEILLERLFDNFNRENCWYIDGRHIFHEDIFHQYLGYNFKHTREISKHLKAMGAIEPVEHNFYATSTLAEVEFYNPDTKI